MIVSFEPSIPADGAEVKGLLDYVRQFSGVTAQVQRSRAAGREVIEIFLTGEVDSLPRPIVEQKPGVRRLVAFSEKFRLIGRHQGALETFGFDYNGVRFDAESFHVFAGLCAVDQAINVQKVMAALHGQGLVTARMGAYKPRTSPYDFQGHGRECLSYVFEHAGRYGIKVIAMEVLHESHIDEIRAALDQAGRPTGVMLQIGTRNAQNFELLKHVGQQREFPILYKRGMGITLEESLNACEYIASEGNRNIVFCLRGVKTHLGDPHRNLVDFAHVPVVQRLTRLPVCIDPSHSVGSRRAGPDGLTEIQQATAQGVIVGANMVLIDFHPEPTKALCDGPQALTLEELSPFLEDVRVVREAYLRRQAKVRARSKEAPSKEQREAPHGPGARTSVPARDDGRRDHYAR